MPILNSLSAKNLNLPGSIAAIIHAAPMPGLADQPTCAITMDAIDKLDSSQLSPMAQISPMALAGLWLLAGQLDRSHELSQSDSSANGSFWHGIMHRREGDFWNANYWFRKVGRHQVLSSIAEEMVNDGRWSGWTDTLVQNSRYDPSKLTDHVERVIKRNEPREELEQIAWLEWQHLFAYCWKVN